MTELNPNAVVVAVGHDPIDAALGFAADEAERAGCGLHLVHVVHVLVTGSEYAVAMETELEQAGRQLLDAALERAHALAGDVPVAADLRVGPVVPTVVGAAEEARMIVLERRDLSTVSRVVTRSVTSGVAARTRVPVVSVPSHWSQTRAHADVPEVVVGVHVAERAQPLLRTAAGAARSRNAALRVLHTWKFPSGFDEIMFQRTENEKWAARATDAIQQVIEELHDDLEGVTVEIEARHAYAADALLEAGEEAELLVLGRHDPLLPFGSHLGPVARAVLREADCPVMLVHPRAAHDAGGGDTTADD